MDRIRNIVFDFGGVLLDWDPRYLYRTFFWDEAAMERFLTTVCTPEWNAEQDRGRSFAEGIRLLQESHPEYREAIRLYRDGWTQMLRGEIPGTVELLRKLKAGGYAIYGLTNWSAETIGYAYERFDFFKLFDGIVVSGEERLLKPDCLIYRILLNRYNLQADKSIFIDDSPANVEAAAKLGFKAILFDDISNVAEKIQELLG